MLIFHKIVLIKIQIAKKIMLVGLYYLGTYYPCDLFPYTNYCFMYATQQYTKIHFTCLITMSHVPRHVINS